MAPEALLRLVDVSKRYDGPPVLDRVRLDLAPGEIHALVGQNGSGKSTLIRILAGYTPPEEGSRAWLDGEPMALGAARPDQRRRLHFIHQSLNLVPSLNALDNAALGVGYPTRLGRIDWARHRANTSGLIGRLLPGVDLESPVERLSAVEQTVVAIARALGHWTTDRSVLVLDEPTAALPAHEVEVLFEAVREVAGSGAAVLFVSHRLPEVFRLSQRVTVIRAGRAIGTWATSSLDEDSLVAQMLGRRLETLIPSGHRPARQDVCRVDGLSAGRLRDVSFSIARGEVLGVAGLEGSGREELAEVVFGARPRARGDVSVSGRAVPSSPAAAIAAGVALVPADRQRAGCLPAFSVRTNVTLPRLGDVRRSWGWIDRRRERSQVERLMGLVGLDPPAIERPVAAFSGGNQQKVVFGKWLRMRPKVLLLDEPMQGIDVAAKATIFELIAQVAKDGAAVLMCSAVTEDLEILCDRVLVFHEGRIGVELGRDELDQGVLGAEVLRRRAPALDTRGRAGENPNMDVEDQTIESKNGCDAPQVRHPPSIEAARSSVAAQFPEPEPTMFQAGPVELSGLRCPPSATPRGMIVALHGGTYDARYYALPGELSFLGLAASLGYVAMALDRPGYGASAAVDPSHLTFSAQRDLLATAVSAAWESEGLQTGGVVLVGHSIGGMLALEVAAGTVSAPVVGVDAAGIGAVWQPGLRELWTSMISAEQSITLPAEARNDVMYGPPWAYDAAVQSQSAEQATALPMPELRDVVHWADRIETVAPSVDVPVRIGVPEFDAIWDPSSEALDVLRSLFVNAPVVEIGCVPASGHSINAHHAGRAHHLHSLAFAEECLLRARRPPQPQP